MTRTMSSNTARLAATVAAIALVVVGLTSRAVADGGVQRWEATYLEGEPAFTFDVALDPSGSSVFVTGGTNTTYAKSKIATVAYDAASGHRLWAATYPGGANAGLGRLVAVSPDGDVVFVSGTTFCRSGCDYSYVTVAYDASTGDRLWARSIATDGGGSHDMQVSPDGASLYVAGDASHRSLVLAYDAATGDELWRLDRPSGSAEFTAMTLAGDGSVLFMIDPDVPDDQAPCYGEGGGYRAVALNAESGAALWSATFDNDGDSCALPTDATVTPDGARLLVTGYENADPGNHGSQTVAFDATTGEVAWDRYDRDILTVGGLRVSIGMDPDGTKVVLFGSRCERLAFGCDEPVGATFALDVATGAKVWSSTYTGGGKVYAFDLDVAPDGSAVYVTGQEDLPCGDPCLDGVPTTAPLIAYDLDTGAENWARVGQDSWAQALTVSPDSSNVFLAGASTSSTSAKRVSRLAGCSGVCGYATSRFNAGSGPGRREDTDVAIEYDGWRGTYDGNASGGSVRVSAHRGDFAVFTTPATSVVSWLSLQGPNRGKARVVIDGRSRGVVDLYNATVVRREVMFDGLRKRPHTIKIKVLGRRGPDSRGKSVVVDGFSYSEQEMIAQDTAPEVRYGAWIGRISAGAGRASLRQAGKPARATIRFSGRRLIWVTATGPAYGKARFVVDGKALLVDLYSPRPRSGVTIVSRRLPRGDHRASVVVLGRGNHRSNGTGVVINAFVARN